MPRKEKQYHYLYKTTNLINSKFYVGMHSTDDLEDEYLGSGLILKRSIRKYGKDNFKFEIITFFKNRNELIEAEKNLVNLDLIQEELCMNLKPGGQGGFCNEEHQIKFSTAGTLKTILLRQTDEEWVKAESKIRSANQLKIYKSGKRKVIVPNWQGKNHITETKNKIGNANSIKQKGELNSQYGTCWITKDKINKKIKKEELNQYINLGWCKGRK